MFINQEKAMESEIIQETEPIPELEDEIVAVTANQCSKFFLFFK